MSKMTDPRDLFLHELGDILYAEKVLVKALPKLAQEASDDELRAGFEEHLEETRMHVENVEKAFAALGEKAKAEKCPGIEGIKAGTWFGDVMGATATEGRLAMEAMVQALADGTAAGGIDPLTTLPDTLARERKALLVTLDDGWWKALLFALGNWLFDYLALLAAIAATGEHVRPTLVLLAYAASMVLGMIPITPGGLGFVEAGLTGLLALAGIPAGPAAVAVLAYRMVSFWLPLPAGAIAAGLHRRHYRDRAEALRTTS